MGFLRAQGAIELRSSATAGTLLGQGATEYLVLLAVVLIVSLVSVALLGFFPGMASDAQITQSQMYWRSASPVAITETAARAYNSWNGYTAPYIRVKNVGAYPIRLTAIIGADGLAARRFDGSSCGLPVSQNYNISDYYYLSPGEEKYFAHGSAYGLPCEWHLYVTVGGASIGAYVGGASSSCQNSTTSPGVMQFNSFGFEYIEYIEGQQITKRQMGKALIIKCGEPTA